jgi:hypothetical protein
LDELKAPQEDDLNIVFCRRCLLYRILMFCSPSCDDSKPSN